VAGILPVAASRAETVAHLEVAPKEKELVSLRNATSSTFETPSGERKVEISTSPINFQAADGSWTPIDNNLVPSSRAGYAFENAANAYRVYLPAELHDAPVRIEKDGQWVEFALRGARGAPDVSGSTAIYHDAFPGVDLRYDVTPTGVKEGLVLKGPGSQRQFPYSVSMSPGLSQTADGDGGSTILHGGKSFATTPSLFMFDAAGATSPDVEARAANKGSGDLVVSPDSAWLDSGQRSWPVTLDPTYTFEPLRSCWIGSGGTVANTANCTGTYIRVGLTSAGDKRRGLIKFDLSTIPTDSNVTSADVQLTLDSAQTTNANNPSNPANYVLRRIDPHSWTTGVTWNKYDGTSSWDEVLGGGDFGNIDAASLALSGATSGVKHFYPQSLVQNWVNGNYNNRGFVIKQASEGVTNQISFYSGSAADSSTHPKLVITYDNHLPSVDTLTPATGFISGSTTPTLGATYRDVDPQDPGTITFKVYRAGTTDVVASYTSAEVMPDTPVTWTIPANSLTRGSSYEWTAEALEDALHNPVVSARRTLTVASGGQITVQSSSANVDTGVWNYSFTSSTGNLQAPGGPCPTSSCSWEMYSVYQASPQAQPLETKLDGGVVSNPAATFTHAFNNISGAGEVTEFMVRILGSGGGPSYEAWAHVHDPYPLGSATLTVGSWDTSHSPIGYDLTVTGKGLKVLSGVNGGPCAHGSCVSYVQARHNGSSVTTLTNSYSSPDSGWTLSQPFNGTVLASDITDLRAVIAPNPQSNSSGDTYYGPWVPVDPPQPPTPPSALLAHADTQRKVSLSWADNSPHETGFELQRAADSTFASVQASFTPGVNITSLTDQGLSRSHNYCYRIRAANAYGNSAWSSSSCTKTPGIPDKQSRGAGSVAKDASATAGDPVNTATGSFTASATDLSLPGIGPSFDLSRSYDSADTDDGPFGPGWSSSYGWKLTFLSDGDAVLRGGDGQQLAFDKQTDGSFLPDPGATTTLSTVSGGYLATTNSQMRYSFDSSGRLTQIKDRNNRHLDLSYDGAGHLSSITDTVGRTVTFATNTSGKITGVTLPSGRSVTYAYTSGLLTSVTDVRGNVVTYAYDEGGRLQDITDQNLHRVVHNTFGTSGRVTQQEDARGNVTTFSWDSATETSTMTDPRGHQWQDVYSGNVLERRIDPLGHTTWYGYDEDLNLTSVTDPRGNETTMTYDSRGNMLTRVAPSPLSYDETFTYNALNDVTSYRDGRHKTTTYSYDAAGNLTGVSRPGGIDTTFGLDTSGNGLVRTVTDDLGNITHLDYDSNGNPTQVTSPGGSIATFGYDSDGRRTQVTDPRGNETGAVPADYRWNYAYDAANHLTSVTSPLGYVTSFTYDPAGNRASVTDARQETTSYSYDAANHLTGVTAPDATATIYGYDAAGNLHTRTDVNGHTTTYSYDDANHVTDVTSPGGKEWSYTYDPSGNVIKTVDAAGNSTPSIAGDGTTNMTHDELGRVETVSYSDGTPSVSYSYDADGNRTQMMDGAGTATYAYDDLGRLTSATRGQDTFSYLYGDGLHLTQRTYPGGAATSYDYTVDGELSHATSDGGATTYGYDAAGNLTSTVLPQTNGYTESRSYDPDGRLASVTNAKGNTVLSQSSYVRDEVGDPSSVTTDQGVTTYGYDSSYRLTDVCFQASCPGSTDPFIRYTYDGVGNRLTEDRPAGTTTYHYNSDDHLTDTVGPAGTTNYGYDPDGNETSAGSKSYSYDLANRMTSATAGSTTTIYTYDGDGTRLSSSTGTQVGDTTNFVWDVNNSLPQIALERDGSGASLRRYTYGNARISMTTGGAASYYHYDGIGSVVNMTDASGATQWRYSYEPFGATRGATQVDPAAPQNPMRFTGEYLDPTELYHLRARQYDPALGQFTASDPLAPSTDAPYVAPYSYADSRPTVRSDPTGERAGCVDGACIGAGSDFGPILSSTGAAAAGGVLAGLLIARAHILGEIPDCFTYERPYLATGGRQPMPDFLPTPPPDFTASPGEGWKWEGGERGQWHNRETGESLRPDANNPEHDPHWDYSRRGSDTKWRIYPDGTAEPK
jgi:RHS repeat-associated protein